MCDLNLKEEYLYKNNLNENFLINNNINNTIIKKKGLIPKSTNDIEDEIESNDNKKDLNKILLSQYKDNYNKRRSILKEKSKLVYITNFNIEKNNKKEANITILNSISKLYSSPLFIDNNTIDGLNCKVIVYNKFK